MTKSIFNFLTSIGFTHPLHPAIVHLPMGMIMGGMAFVLGAIFLNKAVLYETAHYCAVLALISIPPTVFLGYLDWQNSFNGAWMPAIKIKMGLTVVMTILLAIIIKSDSRTGEEPNRYLILHGLTTLTAVGMGYTGGQVLFG